MVPDRHAAQVFHAEHVARYRFAAAFVRDHDVLDVACGAGYGSAILAEAGAASVAGLDRSLTAIEHAARRYAHPRLRFLGGDALHLPFADATFGRVVSFETIEHLPDPGRFLDEIRRVLRPDGLAIVSTPNPDEYPRGNPHHIHEMTRAAFEGALRARFADVRLLFQRNRLLSQILAETDAVAAWPAGAAISTLGRTDPGFALYFVALASVTGATPAPPPSMLLADDEALRTHERAVTRLNQLHTGRLLTAYYAVRARAAHAWRRLRGRG